MDKQQIHLLISGRVQGVGFRAATERKARELGVLGWVRNLPDGRVEVMAQASPEILEEFIRWCHRGPLLAHVTQVVQTISKDTIVFEATFQIQ